MYNQHTQKDAFVIHDKHYFHWITLFVLYNNVLSKIT